MKKVFLFCLCMSFLSLASAEDSMLWLTDTHVDRKSEEELSLFIEEIQRAKPSCICLTGDIGKNETTPIFLERLSNKISVPIFFVLGNHDYYFSSIEGFTKRMGSFAKEEGLFYLPDHNFISLNSQTAIVGIDNWHNLSDNDFSLCSLRPHDFDDIEELKRLDQETLVTFFEAKAQKSIEELEEKLVSAFKDHRIVYALLHVPPFHSKNFYDEETRLSEWSFFWSCDPIGQWLLQFIEKYPNKSLIVLSGHTHIESYYKPLENLEVYIGQPAIQSCVFREFSLKETK